jgi:hypothetical protein
VAAALRIATNRKTAEQVEALRRLGEIFARMPDFDRSQAWRSPTEPRPLS